MRVAEVVDTPHSFPGIPEEDSGRTSGWKSGFNFTTLICFPPSDIAVREIAAKGYCNVKQTSKGQFIPRVAVYGERVGGGTASDQTCFLPSPQGHIITNIYFYFISSFP